jgi:hypothetical protein
MAIGQSQTKASLRDAAKGICAHRAQITSVIAERAVLFGGSKA